VVKILSNSLREKKIVHAYLFCGPRGVGKTTTARILAMALNCHKGITPSPCGQCGSCFRIRQGSSLDVMEIDAASHRGIDEIRELREKAKYAPLESRFKVYIVDEVHMLTHEAFNALLKTLEEPPQHVVFILATTDVHRLPETILSRCARFVFNPISAHDIIAQLRKMALAEGCEIEEEVFHLIARKAEGSLRDAEVFLEQLFAWGEKKIDVGLASSILREIDEGDLERLWEMIRQGDHKGIFLWLEEWIQKGLAPEDILRGLLHYFHDLFVASLTDTLPLGDLSHERKRNLQRAASSVEPSLFREILEELHRLELKVRRTLQPRILLEVGLFKIATMVVPPSPSSSLSVPHEEKTVDRPPQGEEGQKTAWGGDNGEGERDFWSQVLEEVKKAKISLYAFLQAAQVQRENASKLKLLFSPHCQFHKESVERRENLVVLEEIMSRMLGTRCHIECGMIEESVVAPSGSSSPPSIPRPREERRENKPLLVEVTDLFSGIVVNYSVSEEIRGEWDSAELEKSDEGSTEDAGENG